MDDNDLRLLDEYTEELNLYERLTLKDLIDSHRTLRELNMQKEEEYRAECKRGYDYGYQQGKMQALKYDFISREDLKKMTVKELVNLLYDGDE